MAYSQYNRRRFEGEKPVKEGDTYNISIEATGAKGDGIGKIKGFVVIVPNAKPGQTVQVKVDAVRGKVAFGTMLGEASGSKPEPAEEKTDEGSEAEDQAEPEEAQDEPSEDSDDDSSSTEEAEEQEEESENEEGSEDEEEPADEDSEEKKE